jgi:probable rRNA maturation factor
MTIQIEISIECEGWRELPSLEALVAESLQAALEESGDVLAEGAEISLLFCDDARIRKLNREFRGLDKSTNVLSFPTLDLLETAPFIGDIAVAYETVARESEEQGRSLDQHSRHMIVHGFLHLLGYDHEDEDEAEAMEALEVRVLDRLGVENPYREDERKEIRREARS